MFLSIVVHRLAPEHHRKSWTELFHDSHQHSQRYKEKECFKNEWRGNGCCKNAGSTKSEAQLEIMNCCQHGLWFGCLILSIYKYSIVFSVMCSCRHNPKGYISWQKGMHDKKIKTMIETGYKLTHYLKCLLGLPELHICSVKEAKIEAHDMCCLIVYSIWTFRLNC